MKISDGVCVVVDWNNLCIFVLDLLFILFIIFVVVMEKKGIFVFCAMACVNVVLS